MNQYDEYEFIELPSGEPAIIAKYIEHGRGDYNSNKAIQALPPTLDNDSFIDIVQSFPRCTDEERELPASVRYDLVGRLTAPIPGGYFQPLNRHIALYQAIAHELKEGYLARNFKHAKYARRGKQLHKTLIHKGSNYMEHYSPEDTSATGITILGYSGSGKSTTIKRTLRLYPKVFYHPEEDILQITYITVECPHTGLLKDLCLSILKAIDDLLGTNYYDEFAPRRGHMSKNDLLVQVAILVHKYCIGMIIIDELQFLTDAKQEPPEQMLNYFVSLINCVGVPIVRIGTNKAVKLIDKGMKHVRRAYLFTWDLMNEDSEDWNIFFEGVFEAHWTKTKIDCDPENENFIAIKKTYFKRTQGVADLCIKLHKVVQWRLMALGGGEVITPEIVNSVADEIFVIVQPILDAIELARTQGRTDLLEQFDDIKSFDTAPYEQKYQALLEAKQLRDLRERAKRQQKSAEKSSAVTNYVLLELIKLDVEPALAKLCAEKVVDSKPEGTEVSALVKEAMILALEGKVNKGGKKVSKHQTKTLTPIYASGDLRLIGMRAEEAEISVFDGFKEAGVFEAGTYPDAVQWLLNLSK